MRGRSIYSWSVAKHATNRAIRVPKIVTRPGIDHGPLIF